jgi:hypothetical protein
MNFEFVGKLNDYSLGSMKELFQFCHVKILSHR